MRSKKESRASMIVTYSSPSSRGESLRCEKFNFASTEVCASKNFYFWFKYEKQPPDVFYEKSVLKSSVKFTGKHLC